MMRILFCNIAWMKEYRGNEDGKDTPLNGGSYVDETGDAHEKYNFTPVNMEGREGLYCLGFFETKSHNGKDVNQMRIENIAGCELLKKEESVDDVLVVYCAKHPAHKFTTVVGWYKHATVFRHYQEAVFAPEDIQYYNAIATHLIVSYFLQGSDQERYNGKSQENQMVGLMDLDGQMCGMQVKKIVGYKIILRD